MVIVNLQITSNALSLVRRSCVFLSCRERLWQLSISILTKQAVKSDKNKQNKSGLTLQSTRRCTSYQTHTDKQAHRDTQHVRTHTHTNTRIHPVSCKQGKRNCVRETDRAVICCYKLFVQKWSKKTEILTENMSFLKGTASYLWHNKLPEADVTFLLFGFSLSHHYKSVNHRFVLQRHHTRGSAVILQISAWLWFSCRPSFSCDIAFFFTVTTTISVILTMILLLYNSSTNKTIHQITVIRHNRL